VFCPHISTHTLYDVEVNESEVLIILYSLDVNKAAGIDKLHGPKVFRYTACALSLLKPICHLFAASKQVVVYQPNDIPTVLHLSINPVLNPLVRNYRPISLLCVLSEKNCIQQNHEIFRRIIYKTSVWSPPRKICLTTCSYCCSLKNSQKAVCPSRS